MNETIRTNFSHAQMLDMFTLIELKTHYM